MVIDIKTLKYKGKIMFEKIIMSAGFKRIPKLFSEDEACFLFITKGAFLYRTPTNLFAFSEGDAMLSKCGNYFFEQVSINQDSKQETIAAIGAYFYPGIIKKIFQTDLSIQNFQNNFDTIKVSVEPLLKLFVESVSYMIDNPSLVDEDFTINKLKELLLILSKSEKAESVNAYISSLFVPYEYDFNEIIQQNLYANLSLAELAQLCNLSLATFKRKFTNLYGQSPARYFLLKQLEKSKQLLSISSIPISDIAYECGFNSISNFDRAFKKHFKKSPKEYRLS